MSTTLHSFIDIFDSEFETDGTPVKIKKIVIPIIQRDYAQGRENPDVNRMRTRFLSSLHDAIDKQHPITLDFVYGDVDGNGIMTPLDGQQRLTTLFLFHWYAAKRENIPESEWKFLYNFSYQTILWDSIREVKTLRFPRHVPGRWSATFLTASVTTLTICIR